jgi:hypothetical protein
MICCIFLLGLINDGEKKGTQWSDCLDQCLEDCLRKQTDIIEEPLASGGEKQLRMFLIRPAGAGKSTAVKVAQRFCFEFSRSVGVLWSNSTFLFTAYTRSAASIFDGVTSCKHAYLKTRDTLTEKDIALQKDFRILIIDELSFTKDSELQKLDNRL